LKLQKPLAIFDLEATGLDSRTDRIVEISVVKLMPDGSRSVYTRRVNPQIAIPEPAVRIHGITNTAVAGCPTFDAIAPELHTLFENCDLGGYNVLHFDIPLISEEFLRARIKFSMDGRRVVDAQKIFHKKEPRDLEAAVMFFCNEKLDNAHGAEADALATLKVLEAQLERYADIPQDMEGLDKFCNPRDPEWVDRAGRLKWDGDEVTINFGQKKGVRLRSLVKDDPKYLRWILRGDFPRDTQEIIRAALEDNKFPARETESAK